MLSQRAPPAPEARFRVLALEEAARVSAARRQYAESPLALGVLFARLGLLNEARQQLEVVAAANPSSRAAQQLLASLNSQLSTPDVHSR